VKTLSVLSLNILHDAAGWKERSELIRRWLDLLDPDLVGFQEVLRGDALDQGAELLAGRGYHLDYVTATDFWRDPSVGFGNAAASRWPIADREELRLPDGGDGERRAALSITAQAPPGPISFTVTHLNWRFHHGGVRERQMAALCDFVRRRRPRDGFPPVLVGDMNAEPESSEIRYAKGLQSFEGRSVHFRDAWAEAGDGGPGLTWSNRNDLARVWLEPERRIDYIFVGPPRPGGVGLPTHCRVVCDAQRGGVWPSDHFGVYAELRVEPDPSLLPS
jgi:endonuclease/exonuclease/phosphatase family metal-dependent hydrolase